MDMQIIELGQMTYFDLYPGDNQLWTPTLGGFLKLKYATYEKKIFGSEN